MKAKFQTKFQRGFTLVELLVVVALVAILAAIAIMVIDPVALSNKAKDSALKATLDKIGLAASGLASADESGNFPTIAVLVTSLTTSTVSGNTLTMTVGSVGSTVFTYRNTGATGCVSTPAKSGGADWRWCSSNGTITQAGVCTAGC